MKCVHTQCPGNAEWWCSIVQSTKSNPIKLRNQMLPDHFAVKSLVKPSSNVSPMLPNQQHYTYGHLFAMYPNNQPPSTTPSTALAEYPYPARSSGSCSCRCSRSIRRLSRGQHRLDFRRHSDRIALRKICLHVRILVRFGCKCSARPRDEWERRT
jgi:hypothetical protein